MISSFMKINDIVQCSFANKIGIIVDIEFVGQHYICTVFCQNGEICKFYMRDLKLVFQYE